MEIYVQRLNQNLHYQETAIALFLQHGMLSKTEAATAVGMVESLRLLNRKMSHGLEVVELE